MSSERPRFLSKKNLARFGFAVPVLVSGGVIFVAQGIFSSHQESPPPHNAVEAAGDFLRLQQTVMNGLGPKSYIDPQPFQTGQRFNIDGRQYTFLLDKEHKEAPFIEGYKRTLIVEKESQQSKYVMYDERRVYKQITPSNREPLAMDKITQLSETVRKDFQEWQKSRR